MYLMYEEFILMKNIVLEKNIYVPHDFVFERRGNLFRLT